MLAKDLAFLRAQSPATLLALGFVVVAVAVRLFFWIYTNRVWEDSLTAVLHVEYLFQRHSLSHLRLDGHPVQGFTSPLSIFVAIIGGALDLHGTYALPFTKLVSLVSGAVAVWLASVLIQRVNAANTLAWLVFSLSYIALEHHQILWGMAGMETQMAVAIVLFAFWACTTRSVRAIGISLALALYVRPDFAFLDAIIVLYVFFFVDRTIAIKATALGALLYVPWLVFAAFYYGSPVPNTILAKLYGYDAGSPPLLRKLTNDIWIPLGPSFGGHGSGYKPLWDRGVISIIVAALFLFGAYNTVRRRQKILYVPTAFVLVYWIYYLIAVDYVFGWYLVPISATTVLVAGYGLACALERSRMAAFGAAGAFAAATATILPVTFKAEHDIQTQIEHPVREAMGRYLGEVMRPRDRVGMEPLGYSSYYSRRAILDYPGLISPEVVRFSQRRGAPGLCATLEHFRPQFVALRPSECRDTLWLAQNYRPLREFHAPPEANDILLVSANIDREFTVFQRTGEWTRTTQAQRRRARRNAERGGE
jgi:hypothetical protein